MAGIFLEPTNLASVKQLLLILQFILGKNRGIKVGKKWGKNLGINS